MTKAKPVTTSEAPSASAGEALIRATQALGNITQLLGDIKGALGTEETGEALVEVARNAHRAEQELAGIVKSEMECPDPDMSLHRIATALEDIVGALIDPDEVGRSGLEKILTKVFRD